jgi:hypothetical protein
MTKVPFEDVPIGTKVALQYETVNFGVKTDFDTVEFENGGSLAAIAHHTVKCYVEEPVRAVIAGVVMEERL